MGDDKRDSVAGAGRKTRTIVLEVIEGQDCPPISEILSCWRIRGRKLETPLPFGAVRNQPNGERVDPKLLAPRLYVYRHSGSEEYVICCPIRDQKNDAVEGQASTWSTTGVLSDVSASRTGIGSSDQDGEGSSELSSVNVQGVRSDLASLRG